MFLWLETRAAECCQCPALLSSSDCAEVSKPCIDGLAQGFSPLENRLLLEIVRKEYIFGTGEFEAEGGCGCLGSYVAKNKFSFRSSYWTFVINIWDQTAQLIWLQCRCLCCRNCNSPFPGLCCFAQRGLTAPSALTVLRNFLCAFVAFEASSLVICICVMYEKMSETLMSHQWLEKADFSKRRALTHLNTPHTNTLFEFNPVCPEGQGFCIIFCNPLNYVLSVCACESQDCHTPPEKPRLQLETLARHLKSPSQVLWSILAQSLRSILIIVQEGLVELLIPYTDIFQHWDKVPT
ncbi:hypothetical protein EK904_006273, partial [Melospiza melodia maxima]